MRFKTWLQNENLAGPGGGPGAVEDPEAMGQSDTAHGVGAWPTYGDNPPIAAKSPTNGYLDKRFYRKAMKKMMKKKMKKA